MESRLQAELDLIERFRLKAELQTDFAATRLTTIMSDLKVLRLVKKSEGGLPEKAFTADGGVLTMFCRGSRRILVPIKYAFMGCFQGQFSTNRKLADLNELNTGSRLSLGRWDEESRLICGDARIRCAHGNLRSADSRSLPSAARS